MPETSTKEGATTVVEDVTKDITSAEPTTKEDSVKLVSSLTALKLPGLTRLSSDVRRDEK